jgi:hypothetical protein
MLMHVFHLHPEVRAYDESASSAAFSEYRIRTWEGISRLAEASPFPAVCFKPLVDSHLIGEFMRRFPAGRFLWVYRHYADVARSSLRRFGEGTTPVKEACRGERGGHWFHEGLSPQSRQILESFAGTSLSELDYACLTWWARNQIVLESVCTGDPRLRLVRYEELIEAPQARFAELFSYLGLSVLQGPIRHVRARPKAEDGRGADSPRVDELCRGLLGDLDRARRYGEARQQQPAYAPQRLEPGREASIEQPVTGTRGPGGRLDEQ